MSGIDQSVFLYVDESIKQCKELAAFIKKRQSAEIDYAKSLLKITGNFQRSGVGGGKGPMGALNIGLQTTSSSAPQPSEVAKAMVQKSSVWRIFNEMVADAEATATAQLQKAKCINQDVLIPFIAYIKEMESVRREHVESVQEYTKSVEEVCNCLKKAKKDMELLQAQTSDFSSSFSKAQSNTSTKERDLEKLSLKVNASVERTLKAQETVKMYKELCNEAQTEYFGVLLPKLAEDILIKEEERNVAALRVMTDYLIVDSIHQKAMNDATTAILGHAGSVEISVDSKEIVDKLIRKEVIHRHQMNADQHSNAICLGYMFVKRGNVVNEWTPQYCVFTYDKFLDFYDPHQMERPHSSISLRESSVIALHDSLFSTKNCIQIIHFSLQTGNELITLSFETETEKELWLSNLRLYAYCCRKCARIHGYSSEMECNTILAEKDHGCRVVRSMEVNVIEAKDLVVEDFGQKGSTPFCMIQIGDLRVAKTRAKEGESPFWGEEFYFDEIRPHADCLKIQVINANRLRRPMHIGYIEIPFDSLKSGGKKTEEWYPVKHSKQDPNHHRGSIRISIKYHVDQVLPRHEYTSFLNFLTEPHFKAMNILGEVAPSSMRAQFAKTVVRLLISKKLEVDGITSFIESDINATNDPHIIFRGNSLGTKAMDILMSTIGMEYLHSTLGAHVKKIYECKESCEVDPLRVESPDALKKNIRRLLEYVHGIWGAILDSADKCPQSFAAIFMAIQNLIQAKWGDNSTVKYSAISGFIFLRFFCPAILSPNLFKLIDDFPDTNRARTFTLLAKIIQSLANLTEFGQKEQYLAEFNPFITEQIPHMKRFIDKISGVTLSTRLSYSSSPTATSPNQTKRPATIASPTNLAGNSNGGLTSRASSSISPQTTPNHTEVTARINLRRETEEFYQLCLQLTREIEAMRDKNKTTSSNVYVAERLLSECKKLSNSHELARAAAAAPAGSLRGSRVSGADANGGVGKPTSSSTRRASTSGVPVQSSSTMPRKGSGMTTAHAVVSKAAVRFGDDYEGVSNGRSSVGGGERRSGRSSVGSESSPSSSKQQQQDSQTTATAPSPMIYADMALAVRSAAIQQITTVSCVNSVSPDLGVSTTSPSSASVSAQNSRPGSPGVALRTNMLRGLGKSGDDFFEAGSSAAVNGSRESMSGDVVGNLTERRSSLWNSVKGNTAASSSSNAGTSVGGGAGALEKGSVTAGSNASLGGSTMNPLKSILGMFMSNKRKDSISAPVDEVNPDDGLAYIQAKGFDKVKDIQSQPEYENWEDGKSMKSMDSFGDALVERGNTSGHSLHPEMGSVQSVHVSMIPRVPLNRQNSLEKRVGGTRTRFSVDFMGKLTGGGSQSDVSGSNSASPKKSFSTNQ
ncbi:hypothetical protein BDR26DRAFT_853830 [Obelidium mucronatum]|nr:hypothetical protein BDR26DRAFT_853830 [Obelidium mucronatum]